MPCCALLVSVATPAAAAGTGSPSALGAPWQSPPAPAPDSSLPVLGSASAGGSTSGSAATAQAASAQVAAAQAQARKTGKPVLVTGLETATASVTAEPNGTELARDYVLPVRVRRGHTWVPVDTDLHWGSDGRLVPAAVPGDAVSFSAGGTGPMAVISASGTSLALSWPGRLPVPEVSGSSATYRDVLPGVDLVLTATSSDTGGFREVLVVRSRVAARDPGLADLTLRVATSGTSALRAAPGGGLAADMTRGRGMYLAPAARMWDSSSVRAGTAAMRAAAASARSVGAGLAAAGYGPMSTTAAPAGGARLASVATRVSARGSALALVPDARLLISPATRFPVFIDPSFQSTTDTGHEQAYDPVQSGSSCTGSHYNSSSYQYSPVGYDDFEGGNCQFSDTDYALYRVGIPSGVFNAHAVLISASFQATEVYSSACGSGGTATLTASWIGGINSGTGWPGPHLTGNNVNATASFAPDANSCGSTEDNSQTVSNGFNLAPDLNAISGSPSNITLRLWEPGNTNEDDHKQFTDNPDLQVTYTDTPSTPWNLEEAASSSGTGSVDCDTSPTDPPGIGKTDSTNGPYLLAKYNDIDGAGVQATIRYWNYTTSSAKTTVSPSSLSDLTSANGESGWQMPASYTSGLANGTVLAWQAQAVTGKGTVAGNSYGPYSSAWSATCYFAVYPTDPDAPALTAGFDQTSNQSVGSQVSFTITQSANDTASEFVWALDKTPPTSSIPAGQTCTTTAATASCTKITGGSATLTISVPSPGPHDLWVYELDSAGNNSGTTNGAPAGSTSTFSGAGDPAVSYTSGASLQANFTAALGAGAGYDNTMISTTSGSAGTADGDGNGDALDPAQLTAAGWAANQDVTVDGATFHLPGFGSASSGPDNLLAANQTIGTGSSGAAGSALVFLATSTHGNVQVGGLASGSPDSGALADVDTTAPAVMGGEPVTGSGCSGVAGFNTTTSCNPASGTITYASGCPAGSTVSYYLTVPDWVGGPSDIAALYTPDRDTSTGLQADSPNIYAFAVPLDASCTVTSVTLPDVGATVLAQLTGGSDPVTRAQPALHIFGMALRNTTTATPGVTGSTPSSPSGQAWTGAFESPVEDAYPPPSGTTWGDQTIRIALTSNVSAPASTADVRIKLSDPGFLSSDGTGPLVIGAATIAQDYYGAAPAQTPVPLTFGGASTVTIPEGGDTYSDPLVLPFAVTAGQHLLVSLWIKNSALPYLPMNSFASGALTWFAPGGTTATQNETANTTGTPFTGTGSAEYGAVPVLTALDVTTPEVVSGGVTASPGEPTVVVAGNNVIDGYSSSAQSDALNAPSQRLAGQLTSQGLAAGYGVVDAGVQANQVLADGTAGGGLSLLGRLDADILAEPDVGTVVLDEGLEDVLQQAGSATASTELINAYQLVQTQLAAFGVGDVIIGTLTPCSGYTNSTLGDSCTTTTDAGRVQVNSLISTLGGVTCEVDFDAAVTNGASPEALATGYGTADDVNLTLGASGGYAALAQAIPAGGCPLTPGTSPPSAP